MNGFRSFAGLTADNKLVHPSLAKHSGEFLFECCQRISSLASRRGDEELERETERWIKSYRTDFPVISREARQQMNKETITKVQVNDACELLVLLEGNGKPECQYV